MLGKVFKALLVIGISLVILFHTGRYVWILYKILADGGIYLFEPNLTMLYFELAIASGISILVIFLIGFHIGRISKGGTRMKPFFNSIFPTNRLPQKPETQKEQISLLWDMVCNHMLHRLSWQDIKINFILLLLALIIAFLAVLCTRLP